MVSRRGSGLLLDRLDFIFCWPCISIQTCNKHQLDALFILSLFRHSTSTYFGHICCPSSGGVLYIYTTFGMCCAFQLTVYWSGPKSTRLPEWVVPCLKMQGNTKLPKVVAFAPLLVSKPRIHLTLRRLMSYIYGAPILDVSRSHTTTQHSR